MDLPSRKKIPYRVDAALYSYLRAYGRAVSLPIDYAALRRFTESVPLADGSGRDTLWRTVSYRRDELDEVFAGLRRIYALLKAGGDLTVMEHLRVERIDFCEFGNSQPFRIRIVNVINDNADHFYIKVADASRIYGLELEHLLSPNRMHYLVQDNTLVEEHVMGIPGDVFMREHLSDPGFREVRIAKEFVKFNERCFLRLLGDMRACNYVVDITPDFEQVNYRIRAMDFDQQSYDGRMSFYRPQYFRDNNPLIYFGIRYMDVRSMTQYQHEERSAIKMRIKAEQFRLGQLLEAMCHQPLAPVQKVHQLRAGLADHYRDPSFEAAETMGEILRLNLQHLEEGTTPNEHPLTPHPQPA